MTGFPVTASFHPSAVATAVPIFVGFGTVGVAAVTAPVTEKILKSTFLATAKTISLTFVARISMSESLISSSEITGLSTKYFLT